MICVAKYWEDNKWYRCRVKELNIKGEFDF